MTDADGLRPRPRPVPESEPRPRPSRPVPSPDVPAAEVGAPESAAPESTEPESTEPADGGRPTRAQRRAEEDRSTATPRLSARIGRSVAALCVLAGVAGFVVVRAQDDDGGRAGAAPTSTSSARTDPAAALDRPDLATTFVAAASSGVVTVTESDYRRLDDALSAGLQVTTGAFRTRFRAALTGSAAASRVANRSTTSISVLQAGIGTISASGTTAKVLIFARVTQTGSDIGSGNRSVLVALCVTVVRDGNSYLISDLVQGANAGLPPGSAGLRAAAEAARRQIVDVLTFSRSSFAADLDRAKSGATGAALEQVTSGATALRSRLTTGRYDLAGAVTSVAVRSVTGDTATLLLAATGTRTADDGTTSTDTDGHYVVTVQRSGGGWVVSSLTSVS